MKKLLLILSASLLLVLSGCPSLYVDQAPILKTAVAQSASSVRLEWVNQSNSDISYSVFRYTEGKPEIVFTTGINANNWTDTELDGGTTYRYYVSANVVSFQTTDSEYKYVTTPEDALQTLSTPALLNIVETPGSSSRQKTLTWEAIDGASSYKIYVFWDRYEYPYLFHYYGDYYSYTVTDTTSYVVGGLLSGYSYCFTIRAYNEEAGTRSKLSQQPIYYSFSSNWTVAQNAAPLMYNQREYFELISSTGSQWGSITPSTNILDIKISNSDISYRLYKETTPEIWAFQDAARGNPNESSRFTVAAGSNYRIEFFRTGNLSSDRWFYALIEDGE